MKVINTYTEPVRFYAFVAGLLTAAGGFLVALGQGVDPLVAGGTAIISFGVVVGGGELGRGRAFSPQTFNDSVEAETVISAAEANRDA